MGAPYVLLGNGAVNHVDIGVEARIMDEMPYEAAIRAARQIASSMRVQASAMRSSSVGWLRDRLPWQSSAGAFAMKGWTPSPGHK